MKNTKKICTPYAVWDYELEIEELNRESENKWQLVHGGAFHREYERDDSVVYRYQLDYNNKADSAYYEMFKEQGWEYVNSIFNGWNYFKKPYDELVDESEYLIYTDIDSKKKMISKFINLMMIVFFAAMLANFQHLYNFIETPKIANSGIFLFYGIYILIFVKALIGRSRTLKGIVPKRRTKIELYFIMLIFAVIFMISGMGASYETQGTYETNEINRETENIFLYEVEFSDFYYIDIYTEDGIETPLTLAIKNKDRELVLENSSNEKNEIEQRVFLRRGTYQCIITSMGETKYTVRIE